MSRECRQWDVLHRVVIVNFFTVIKHCYGQIKVIGLGVNQE